MSRSTAVRFEPRGARIYLVAYNLVQFLGWFVVFLKLVKSTFQTQHFALSYAAVGALVRRLQITAFLEVLHAALGLVHSGSITTFMQWAGRSHVLLAIIGAIPEVQVHPGVWLTFTSWSISEIIRYPQYGLTSLGICPRWLTWLRYTLFIVLYPAGVFGEMLVMYAALGPIRKRHLYSGFFDRLPFGYESFVIGLLFVYPFLFLVLYWHMFKQRRTKLSRGPGGSRMKRRA